jgi:hypothetical protein
VVEQQEPHAGRMAFTEIAQPTTFAERCALARRIRDELELPLPIFVDGMDDASRALFSDLPSPAFVIDRQGRIADKLPWADPELLRASLNELLAKESLPDSKTGPWTLEQRDAFARRLVAAGKHEQALAWLEAKAEPAPSSSAAAARAAITRVLALRGDKAAKALALEAALKAAEAAWRDDRARLTAARIELAEAIDGGEPATALWRTALAGLDPRASALTQQWLTARSGLTSPR